MASQNIPADTNAAVLAQLTALRTELAELRGETRWIRWSMGVQEKCLERVLPEREGALLSEVYELCNSAFGTAAPVPEAQPAPEAPAEDIEACPEPQLLKEALADAGSAEEEEEQQKEGEDEIATAVVTCDDVEEKKERLEEEGKCECEAPQGEPSRRTVSSVLSDLFYSFRVATRMVDEETLLRTLVEMGFEDKVHNLELLRKHHGSCWDVVGELTAAN
eukprot:m51a1_g5221 hypothetical protein (220) ;mRNA; r:269904-271022